MHDRIAELRGLHDELANCENGPRKATRAASADDVREAITRVRGELEEQAADLEKRAEGFTEKGLDGLAGADIEEAKKIRAALAGDQETAVESKPRRNAARAK